MALASVECSVYHLALSSRLVMKIVLDSLYGQRCAVHSYQCRQQ